MAKTIQVIVDVESESVTIASDKALTLTQQIKLLRAELQKTPEGTKEFNLLVTKLNDTQDALGRVNIKGKELFGTLGLIPGPIGEIAARTNSAIDALKIFGKLSVSDLKSQFAALGSDLKDVITTIGRLTGITKVYTVINNALAKSFTAIGIAEGTAAAGARAFAAALTATGVGALVIGLGFAVEKVTQLGSAFFNAGEEAKKAYEKSKDLIDRGKFLRSESNKLQIAELKKAGANEEMLARKRLDLIDQNIKIEEARQKIIFTARAAEIRETINILGFNNDKIKEINERYDKEENKRKDNLIKLETERVELVTDTIIEFRKKREEKQKELDDKEAQRQEKLKQERLAALKEIGNNEREAILSLLTDREAELQKITDDYKAKIALATKYGQDTILLEEAYKNATREKRAEFEKEDYEAFEEQLEKDLKAIEDSNKSKLDAESIAAELKFSKGLQSEEEYQAELLQIKLKYSTSDQERQQAEIDFLEFSKGKQKEYEDTVLSANQALSQSYIDLASSIGSSFVEISRIFEQGSDLQKTFAIIGVLINAAASIGKIKTSTAEAVADFSKTIATGTATLASGVALASNPITAILGAFQIAAGKKAIAVGTAGIATAKSAGTIQQVGVGISAAAQIAAITSAGKSKSSSSSGGGASGGGATTPTFSGTVSVPAPVIGASQASPTGGLGQTIAGAVQAGNSRSRPIQTYVIGDQISTQQQLDRRISLAAKMGG